MLPSALYAQATFVYAGAALPHGAVWTLGLQLDGAESDMQGFTDDLGDFWGANFDDVCVDQVTLLEVRVKRGPDASGLTYTRSVGAPGTVSDPPAPPQVAMLVKKVANEGGRKNQARAFLPGLWDGAVGAGGLVASGTVSAFQSKLDLLYGFTVTSGVIPVVLHGHGDDEPTEIVAFTAQGQVATQRQRNRR